MRGRTFICCWLALVGALSAAEHPRCGGELSLLDADTDWRANLTVAPSLVRKEGKLRMQLKSAPVELAEFDPQKPGDSLRQFLLPPAEDWQNVEFDDSLWASYDADLFKIFGLYGHGPGWVLVGAAVPVAYLIMEQIPATAPLTKKIGPYYSGIATYALVALAMIFGSLLKPASPEAPTAKPNS